jgi:hypothetical protein
MKKQMKSMVIMGVVLVLLLATWLGTTFVPGLKPGAETTTTTTTLAPVYTAQATDVAQILVHNAKGDLVLLPTEKKADDGTVTVTWLVEGSGQYPMSSGLIEALTQAALTVTPIEEIAAQTTDLATYGLAQPQSTLTIVGKDGNKHVINFGNALPSEAGYYAMLAGSGRVCTVDTNFGEQSQKSLIDLVDQSAVMGGVTSDKLTAFTFIRRKDNLKLMADCKATKDETAGTTTVAFTVREPVVREGNSTNLTPLVDSTLAITATQYVELNPTDVARYGLDKPQLAYVLKTADSTIALAIGNSAGNDEYYALSSKVPAVFKVAASSLGSVDMKFVDMVDRFVAIENIWQVESVTVKAQGLSFTANIAMASDQKVTDDGVAFKLDGRDANIKSQNDNSLFSTFYQRIIGVLIAGIDTTTVPANTHDASITYQVKADLKAGTKARTKVVEFSKRDEYTDYIFIDGTYTGCYIDREATFNATRSGSEGIIIAYKQMLYAMDHAVNGVFNTEEGYKLD